LKINIKQKEKKFWHYGFNFAILHSQFKKQKSFRLYDMNFSKKSCPKMREKTLKTNS